VGRLALFSFVAFTRAFVVAAKPPALLVIGEVQQKPFLRGQLKREGVADRFVVPAPLQPGLSLPQDPVFGHGLQAETL
jgi:hypothetical protein